MTPIGLFEYFLAAAAGIGCILACALGVSFAFWCLWMYMIGARKGRE